ncbi:E3 ubiquitin-protein ligase RNF103 [Elysia marginata]|uniref:E3 ubiquitin-protein ligase RNF103 n=1 Tax=Elysia marginata TaxID=1093978 RepID=A0AAV4IUL5_9GAST|nr:E3 ubiquitin-protein ligase RNF103 [Elysia marginata]
MWLKLCFLLLYILLLFVLARIFEALAWCELGLPGLPSCSSQQCRLLDPVLLSVVQLKALLDQRGLSYEGVVEKSELTELVTVSGQVSVEDAEHSQLDDLSEVETNFTSGAHFIEQVEDAKDSVWLVRVVGIPQLGRGSHLIGDSRWKILKRKLIRFGVRMGHLDCALDSRYCHRKSWHSNFVLLALPSQHQKKANVALYNFSGSPVRETALLRWVRDKLNEKIDHIANISDFTSHWQHLGRKIHLEPEVRVVLFTQSETTPLFYSALSVKFPGRVKFGLVSLNQSNKNFSKWQRLLNHSKITNLPAYVVYTAEKNYTYGARHGEPYSFVGMERFLKSLYPCLNDIFIISFCLANAVSWLELFISNCSFTKRFKKFAWCVFKYNLMVILLWLPIIAIFQMPYLDQFPLLALKGARTFSMSNLGQMLRGDYHYYVNHPVFLFLTFATFVTVLTLLCKRFRSEEIDGDTDWFNFSQMRTLTHLRPNDFFEPMRVGGYDLLGGLDVFGSRLSQPSIWLSPPISPEYIQHLPTWKFRPVSLSERAQLNVKAVEATLMLEASGSQSSEISVASQESEYDQVCPTAAGNSTAKNQSSKISEESRTKDNPSSSENVSAATLTSCNPQLLKTESLAASTQCHRDFYSRHVEEGQVKCLRCGKIRVESKPGSGRIQLHSTLPSSNDLDLERSSPVSSNMDTNSSSPNVLCSTCLQTLQHSGTSNSPQTHSYDDSNSRTGMRCSAHTPSLGVEVSLPHESHHNSKPYPSETSGAVLPSRSQAGGNFPAGYLESYQCVICLEEYLPLASLCGLPCGHVFHETCIISWLNRDKHFCPMCRWPSYRPHPSQSQHS